MLINELKSLRYRNARINTFLLNSLIYWYLPSSGICQKAICFTEWQTIIFVNTNLFRSMSSTLISRGRLAQRSLQWSSFRFIWRVAWIIMVEIASDWDMAWTLWVTVRIQVYHSFLWKHMLQYLMVLNNLFLSTSSDYHGFPTMIIE